jgi:predicted nuclease of predicted toxin-antitoxin system
MKLLLDESIPRRLAEHFPKDMDVRTVPQMGWAGMKNGKLLAIAATDGFTALITADRGIEYQQNSSSLPLSVIILRSYRTRLEDLIPLVPRAIETLRNESEIGIFSVAL